MSSRVAIQLDGLSKTYRRRGGEPIQAVKNVDLSVPQGQVFGFLGPNGAGKTTTIKMLCALVKPTSGRARINGYDVWRKRGTAVRQVGAVLEGTRNVHWTLSPWDNLIYFGNLKGLAGKALRTRAEALLRELELWERRKDLVRTFSRGMQQKVAIACALIADPPVLLLDEPTLGLDVQAARTVKELIKRLVKEYHKTVVLTTHQLDMAEELCERVAIISKGRIIADQPVDELIDLFSSEYYQIRVQGHLPERAEPAIAGFAISVENEETLLSGPIADQDALYGVLNRLHDLGLHLLSARLAEPDLEEVFVRMLDTDDQGGGR
ncbi:MAG: ABC transporter ATP-binding protein [Anaerolineae bacterium]|nr:ABC transporter ATP-binding protein [Anaerolineae bacterium]